MNSAITQFSTVVRIEDRMIYFLGSDFFSTECGNPWDNQGVKVLISVASFAGSTYFLIIWFLVPATIAAMRNISSVKNDEGHASGQEA